VNAEIVLTQLGHNPRHRWPAEKVLIIQDGAEKKQLWSDWHSYVSHQDKAMSHQTLASFVARPEPGRAKGTLLNSHIQTSSG